MDKQFTDLSLPDPGKKYYINEYLSYKNFTFLMKLVLVVNKFPDVLDLIRVEIDNNPSSLNKINDAGYSALMLSCLYCKTYSNIDCVKLLIELGADVNSRSNTSALLLAAQHSNSSSSIECVKLLISCKANINFHDFSNKTILMYAVENYGITSTVECIDLLIKSGADVNARCNHIEYDALTYAVINYDKTFDTKCLQLILNHCNINSQSPWKKITAVMVAACRAIGDKIGCIKLLINNGADLNIQDSCGNTAITHVYNEIYNYHKYEYINCIKLLLSAGADVNIESNQLLTYALPKIHFSSKHIEYLKVLIDAGINLNNYIDNRIPALILMCRYCSDIRYIIYVDLLIRSGANVNILYDSMTPLICLCKFCNFNDDAINTLIDLINMTDDVSIKDCYGKSASDYYMENRTKINDSKLLELLKNKYVVNTKSARKI